MCTGWNSAFWSSLPAVKILTPSEVDKTVCCRWIATRRSISSSGEVGHSSELMLTEPFRAPAPTTGDGPALLLWEGNTTGGISSVKLASPVTETHNLQPQRYNVTIVKWIFHQFRKFVNADIGCVCVKGQIFKSICLPPLCIYACMYGCKCKS